MMLGRRVDRMTVVLRRGVGLCLGVSPPPPLAAGLCALRPLRPRAPVAVDGTRLLVARVYLQLMSYESLQLIQI